MILRLTPLLYTIDLGRYHTCTNNRHCRQDAVLPRQVHQHLRALLQRRVGVPVPEFAANP